MAPSDTSEKGLEDLIFQTMTEGAIEPDPDRQPTGGEIRQPPTTPYDTGDYLPGKAKDYNQEYALDLAKLSAFVKATQPDTFDSLQLATDGPKRRKFLGRLRGEITKRGVIDILRKGVKHGSTTVQLFYGTPSDGNPRAEMLFEENLFSVTRQVRYSLDETQRALDLVLFINGLPIFTFELKNRLTRQTVNDGVEQYRRDRPKSELLFQFGRCVAHFAVDDLEVKFCTHLQGAESRFLPFNKGHDDGRGNPPNSDGLATDYLWREILTRRSLTDILENFAQIVETKKPRKAKKSKTQIFPRYHQLRVVRRLLGQVRYDGLGHRYLIQHSAGSGKSYSIAWLVHQLVSLEAEREGRQGPLFDSVFVITDRRVLDKQIRNTIRQFAQVSSTVGAVDQGSAQLRKFIESGKRIITSTLFKFPVILDELGTAHRGRHFAIVIDEAHSSQGGRTAAKMNIALSPDGAEVQGEDPEDRLLRIMEGRKMLPNASYFAFTATPKNKTLELFGIPYQDGGETKYKPFDTYTMKQAIQEGFILDVLKYYTPVSSYYRLAKTTEGDPEFDTKKAQRKLRHYVEQHEHALRRKAEIMVDHFHDRVIGQNKIGNQARAMVVTGRIQRAIDYFQTFNAYLEERHSPWKAIVAFSGEVEHGGRKVTEASLNGFPSSQIEAIFKENPYRFLICADKFQTGYDEPLLHTMYVDKSLSGVQAVQTLSRLNRSHPKKRDTFVLDFANDTETIQKAFEPYYRTTLLSEETDPNKLHDLVADLDKAQLYTEAEIDHFVKLYLDGAPRDRLDPMLDRVVNLYSQELDEDGQVEFKGKAKTFVRTYGFLASILSYSIPTWEKLSIFLEFLVLKLPAPREDDLSRGILETIDMDSYRTEIQSTRSIALPDQDVEIDPVPTAGGGHLSEPELDPLSKILDAFNLQWGNIPWQDADRISRVIAEEIPVKVAADQAYQNAMRHSDKQNARIEHDRAIDRVLVDLLTDHTDLYKLYSGNVQFKRWLDDQVFDATFRPSPFADLEKRLRKSGDPIDALGASLLENLEHHQRLTLGQAIDAAERYGLTETQAFLALERLARPATANLKRFYIDRSKEAPRLLSVDEVRHRLAQNQPDDPEGSAWMHTIEVTWAESSAKAMPQGATP